MTRVLFMAAASGVLAMYMPTCVPPAVLPTVTRRSRHVLRSCGSRPLMSGRRISSMVRGARSGHPIHGAVYTFVEAKRGGVNPGMTVRDPAGRIWKVKQPPLVGRRAEGPIEVVLSRVLSAVGYHQPPVYYLRAFTVADDSGTRRTVGGRFRLNDPSLKDVGDWSWQQNPFVGTRPYQGLLVILLMFNSSDLKNSNNTLYEFRPSAARTERWYVVRDLGNGSRRHRPLYTCARRCGRVRAQRVHRRSRRRLRRIRVSRLASGAHTTAHHASRRAMGVRAARRAHRYPMARSLSRGRLRPGRERPFHPTIAGKDPRGGRSRYGSGRTGIMNELLSNLVVPHWPTISHGVLVLTVAALLGAALGVVRPVRRGIVPRSTHVVQAQILLAIVGAIIIVVVAESLARAFAIVGAAGLVRYRARIKDVKDAGVMLVALALGLTAGSGMFLFAFVACAFVIGVLWLLESLEPAARSRFDLKISTKNAGRLKPDLEHALGQKGVAYELHRSSPNELMYEVTVPFDQKIRPLTKLIQQLDGHDGMLVEWEIKKIKKDETVRA